MKKLVRTNLTNTPSRRGTKDLNIQFYSHDKNNAGFEFVVKNETDLSQYTAKVLFKFRDSNSTWQSNGTVEGNVVKVSFNTDLIARCEEVLGFLFLDSDSNSLDVFKFKFNVVLSEIDKGEVANRQIKHVNNIGELELVTRSQLTEELSKLQINGVDLTNYLTTTVAEETYATKQELRSYALSKDVPSINGLVTEEQLTEAKKSVVEEVKKLGYAKTTEVPAAYNDSALSERISDLEKKVDKDTVYDDSDLKNRVKALEDRPTTASTSYDDSEVNRRLTVLEARPAGTSYDDSKLIERVKKLEDKPEIDTSHFLTEEILAEKHFISASDVEQTYLKKVDVPTPVNTSKFITDDILTAKNFVTKDELNTLKPNQTLSLNNNTLSVTGGNSVELPVNRYEIHGTGMPNGVVEAEIGTTYIDKNKTNGAFKWIKTTNGGNQGWEVLTGDTGWRRLNILSKLNTASLHIRRVNNMVTYQFGGLDWGWFGIMRRGGEGYVAQPTDLERNCFILNHNQIPEGFRTPNSLIGSIFNDRGVAYGTWYIGNPSDANHLRFQFLNPVPTDRDIGDIRVSAISYFTNDPWPVQLP